MNRKKTLTILKLFNTCVILGSSLLLSNPIKTEAGVFNRISTFFRSIFRGSSNTTNNAEVVPNNQSSRRFSTSITGNYRGDKRTPSVSKPSTPILYTTTIRRPSNSSVTSSTENVFLTGFKINTNSKVKPIDIDPNILNPLPKPKRTFEYKRKIDD